MNRWSYIAALLALSLIIVGCVAPYNMSEAGLHKNRYVDRLGEGEILVNGTYQYALSKTADGHYVNRMFFPETRVLTEETYYSDPKLKMADGSYRSWSDTGTPRSLGQYQMGKKTGEWTIYNSRTGALREVGSYQEDEKTGEWITYHANGEIDERANYVNGLREGSFTEYDSLGATINAGEYRQDTIFRQTLVEEPFAPKLEERMPLFAGCEDIAEYTERKKCADRKMLEFIYGAIRYPANARKHGVEGMAVASFIIERDGTLSDPYVIRGLSQDISEEVLRVISLMPKWEPGMQNDSFVRVQFNLPVRFALD